MLARLQVLESLLAEHGMKLSRLCRMPTPKELEMVHAVLLHGQWGCRPGHWWGFRRVAGKWWDLNSLELDGTARCLPKSSVML